MPKPAGKASGASTLVLRVSVPAHGELRQVATALAGRLAEYLGNPVLRTRAPAMLDSLASRVAPPNGDGEIAFEFHRRNSELVIEAQCAGRSSEVRYRLSS